MMVYLLTEEQKDQLVGKQYSSDSFFNPIQDADDNWIISKEEILYCTNEEFSWIQYLPQIVYNPIPDPDFFI
jgi:hypothetical protein